MMLAFNHYRYAEKSLIDEVVNRPHFITKSMNESWGLGFTLDKPMNNRNERSNYEYAQLFADWIISGEQDLSKELLEANPWVKRFVDATGLPENFSSSYALKIKRDLSAIQLELERNEHESRRAYLPILYPEDKIIRISKTTHEYPCTIGLHFFIRDGLLYLMVNMRSNNLWSVMPYDVFNFTTLQMHLAKLLNVPCGSYIHQINSAHIYKGDVRRILKQQPNE